MILSNYDAWKLATPPEYEWGPGEEAANEEAEWIDWLASLEPLDGDEDEFFGAGLPPPPSVSSVRNTMTTTYYVVPADRHFDISFPDWPSRAMAERAIADDAEDGVEYGIYEVRLVSGSGWMPYQRTMHVVGDRRIITGKHYLGGYSAHDDGLGEDGSPYGYGKTPEAAIEELLEALDHEQNREAA